MKKIIQIIIAFLVSTCLMCAYMTAKAQTWKPNPKYIKKDTVRTVKTVKYQCYGTTKKGAICKRYLLADSFCYLHSNQK